MELKPTEAGGGAEEGETAEGEEEGEKGEGEKGEGEGGESESDDEYVPERVVNHRKRKGVMQYLVKWEGEHCLWTSSQPVARSPSFALPQAQETQCPCSPALTVPTPHASPPLAFAPSSLLYALLHASMQATLTWTT